MGCHEEPPKRNDIYVDTRGGEPTMNQVGNPHVIPRNSKGMQGSLRERGFLSLVASQAFPWGIQTKFLLGCRPYSQKPTDWKAHFFFSSRNGISNFSWVSRDAHPKALTKAPQISRRRGRGERRGWNSEAERSPGDVWDEVSGADGIGSPAPRPSLRRQRATGGARGGRGAGGWGSS